MNMRNLVRPRRTPKATRLIVAAIAGTVLVLSGCTSTSEAPAASTPTSTAESSILADYGLTGLDAEQIVDKLDATPIADRPVGLMASIHPDELLLSDGKNPDMALPMPEDKFYVSFAPYVDQTHDCYFHSLTTCTGELQAKEMQVTVTNTATGETIVDDTMQTQSNGFLGLWLPRNIEATIDVAYGDRSASASLSTSKPDDLTCLTTMQLV